MRKKVLVKGQPASGGVASGRAAVFTKPENFDRLKDGDIAVVPDASPLYSPVTLRASAVVTEKGGYLSHLMIVSRELGIPALGAAENATKAIKTGQKIMVDGGKGIVYEQ